jgi:hypothetical protein
MVSPHNTVYNITARSSLCASFPLHPPPRACPIFRLTFAQQHKLNRGFSVKMQGVQELLTMRYSNMTARDHKRHNSEPHETTEGTTEMQTARDHKEHHPEPIQITSPGPHPVLLLSYYQHART